MNFTDNNTQRAVETGLYPSGDGCELKGRFGDYGTAYAARPLGRMNPHLSRSFMSETRTENKRVIGYSEIKAKYLPHRYPIVMLDRITDYRAGEYIEAIKCVTGNSPELVGHFPDRAIMPATSIVQALAQLAIVFLKLSRGALQEDEMTVVTTTKFKFLQPVFPGDTLKLKLTPIRLEDSVGIFNGSAQVDGKSVVRGSLTLAKANISKFPNPLW